MCLSCSIEAEMHSAFLWYGEQKKLCYARISRIAQLFEIVFEVLGQCDFMSYIKDRYIWK
jgi:hypothetical protein